MTTPGATNASLLWSFFTKTDGGKGKCNTCKLELANSDGNTTGMSRHLQAKHKKEWLDYSKLRDDRDKAKEAEKARRKGHNSKDEPPKKAKLDFFKPSQVDPKLDAEFHDELINHIADTCTSFAQYGGESFQRVVSVLNKRVKVKHPVTLSRIAGKKAEELKKEICAILAAVKDDLVSLGFTTDMWTSRAMDSFLSLTVSFIHKYWVLHPGAGGQHDSEGDDHIREAWEPGQGADILIWWRHNQEELPLLSKLARMILAILASSAKSERVFSVGGLIVSCRRGSLALTKVEQLIVLKENRKKVEEFKETSDYKLKIVNVNAFEKVIAHISEGVMEIVNIEYDDLYEDLDDVEDEDIQELQCVSGLFDFTTLNKVYLYELFD